MILYISLETPCMRRRDLAASLEKELGSESKEV